MQGMTLVTGQIHPEAIEGGSPTRRIGQEARPSRHKEGVEPEPQIRCQLNSASTVAARLTQFVTVIPPFAYELEIGTMFRLLLLGIAASTSLSGSAWAVAPEYEVTASGLILKNVSPDCPMIYDNDWWVDIPDAAYLWTKASQGRCDLRGNIVTRDMWDWQNGYSYKMEQCVSEYRKIREACEKSGLRMQRIPEAVLGADQVLQRPASGKIEDTKFTRSPGSDLIVAEAKKATPEKPLLVFAGGPCTTVANAYLTDPSIGDRMIVFQIDGGGYNGKDAWSWEIAKRCCRFANWARGYFWKDVGKWNAARFSELPRNPLGDLMRKYASSGLGHANQWGDGSWIFFTFDSRCLTKVEDYDKQAITVPKAGTNAEQMEREFFNTMTLTREE